MKAVVLIGGKMYRGAYLYGDDGVDIEMGPDGNLYYLSVTAGELRRLMYRDPTGPVTCPKGQFLAKYYSNMTLDGNPNIERCENKIDNDWGDGGPGSGVGIDNFSTRWVGTFDFEAGDYTFFAEADDGVRVFVDGELLIDQWKDQGPTRYESTRAALTAGEHTVKVEYYENGGGALVRAGWTKVARGGT